MLKQLVLSSLFALAASASSSALANINTGVSFSHVNVDSEYPSLSMKALNIHLGYILKASNTITFVPEVTVGLGVGGDSYYQEEGGDRYSLNTELDRVTSFSIRAEYALNPKVSLFVRPVYSKVKMTGDMSYQSGPFLGSESLSMDTGWDLGAGVGVDFEVGPKTDLTLSYDYSEHNIHDGKPYEVSSNFETVSFGLRYSF